MQIIRSASSKLLGLRHGSLGQQLAEQHHIGLERRHAGRALGRTLTRGRAGRRRRRSALPPHSMQRLRSIEPCIR